MKQSRRLLLFSLLTLLSCRNHNGVLEGFSVLRPHEVEIALRSSSTWPGFCHRVELGFKNPENVDTVSGINRTISISTDLGVLYSDIGCTQTITQVLAEANDSSLVFYFRSPSLGTATLTVSTSDLISQSIALNVVQPTALITLGQQTFNFSTANFPTLSAQSFNTPTNPVIAGGRFFVADYSNHRVLIWNSIPSSTQQAADVVLGQPNMTSNTCNSGGVSAQSLCNPSFVHSDGTRLVVADEGNSRVLIWNTLPTTSHQAADVVLGQTNMTSNVDGSVSPTASSLSFPGGVQIADGRLFVVDSNNNRVLIWNTMPTINAQPAQMVLGQPNMTSNSAGTTSTTLSYPYMVKAYQNKIFVSDFGNSRILVWNSFPTINAQPAQMVLGQPNFLTSGPNSSGLSASSLSEAGGVVIDDQGRFYVFDYSNNRILVWNQIPTINNAAADAVIGQPDFVSNSANAGNVNSSATSLYSPWGGFIHEGILWVADYENHRVIPFEIPY